tara:strand:- start:2086 stop:2304 length:219 start_codon:yes stop_codon:yes gene_type:complete
MRWKRNMSERELFPDLYHRTWEEIGLEELLHRYRSACMCLMEKHHGDVAKDAFRAQMKRLQEVILEKYGEER